MVVESHVALQNSPVVRFDCKLLSSNTHTHQNNICTHTDQVPFYFPLSTVYEILFVTM